MAKFAILQYPHRLAAKGLFMDMNVSLTDELASFVKAKVGTGRYASSSEVVREALRSMESLERREAEKLSYLRKAWQEGSTAAMQASLNSPHRSRKPACDWLRRKIDRMSRVRFTKAAREDLLNIWLQVARGAFPLRHCIA